MESIESHHCEGRIGQWLGNKISGGLRNRGGGEIYENGEVEGNERMDQYICKILLYRGKPPRKILLLMLQTHLLFVTKASVCLFQPSYILCV